VNYERVKQELEEIRSSIKERAQSVTPSREVSMRERAARDEAWNALGDVVKAAKEEGRQIIDGDKATEGDLGAVIVDEEVRDAYERLMDIGLVVHDPDQPWNLSHPPPNDHVRWLMHSLIWDERGVPWTGPLARLRSRDTQ
jgi:hypothetical protein